MFSTLNALGLFLTTGLFQKALARTAVGINNCPFDVGFMAYPNGVSPPVKGLLSANGGASSMDFDTLIGWQFTSSDDAAQLYSEYGLYVDQRDGAEYVGLDSTSARDAPNRLQTDFVSTVTSHPSGNVLITCDVGLCPPGGTYYPENNATWTEQEIHVNLCDHPR